MKLALWSVGVLLVLAEACRAAGPAQERRAFFGELHLHTALSLDAWSYGTKLLPDDAYRFGRGDTVMVPAVQVVKEQGGSPAGTVHSRKTEW